MLDCWAARAELVRAVVATFGVLPADVELADAVFEQVPSECCGDSWRLLGLAGLALWPWPDRRLQSERDTQDKPERKRGRSVNGRAGGPTGEAHWRDYVQGDPVLLQLVQTYGR
jgi:hypothetical protein